MDTCGASRGSVAWWILVSCWSIMIGVWVVGSLYNWRHSGKIERRGSNWWRVATIGAAILLWATPSTLWRSLIVCAPWTQCAGAVILAAATVFTVWARVVLGLMWSAAPTRRQGHELRTNGPYRVTRHPIYTGIIGMVLGTALLNGVGVWGLVLVAIAFGFAVKLRDEERLMRDAFGEAYVSYQRRVPSLAPWPRPNGHARTASRS
jgi:protein-S-isoprenylcysteine O-methyltransferase Ste14